MLGKILYWCAGVDQKLIQQTTGKEQIKQKTIGLTILSTGVIASLSGGYAIFAVFNSLPIATGIGSLWGFTIINLDRSFVLGIKKQEDKWWKQILITIPRLALACSLGLVISKPVELHLAQAEIKEAITLEQVNKVKRLRNESWEKEQIDKITQQNQQLEIEYQKLFAVWQQTEKDAQAEAEGISGSGKRGKGIAYTDKKQLANNLKDSADKVKQEIESNKKRIQELNTQIETKISVENLSGDKPGIIRQLGTLEKLAHDDPNIAKIDFFISLLFILLEVSPVIVKLMSDTGSYDELVTQQENTKIHQFQEEYKVKKNQITAEVKDASDIQQELRLQTKMKVIRLLQEQFSQLMQQVNDPNNPQVQAIQSQALKIMLDNLKDQMIKQARLFKVMGYEIEEELHRSKQRMLQQNVQQKVKHTVTEAKVERLEQENLQPLKDDYLSTQEPDLSSFIPYSSTVEMNNPSREETYVNSSLKGTTPH